MFIEEQVTSPRVFAIVVSLPVARDTLCLVQSLEIVCILVVVLCQLFVVATHWSCCLLSPFVSNMIVGSFGPLVTPLFVERGLLVRSCCILGSSLAILFFTQLVSIH